MKFQLCYGLLLLSALTVLGQSEDLNQRGVDPRVDYNDLYQRTVSIGIPWDDRNLGLTKEDLEKLPPRDFEDTQNVPVWFRVMLRGQYLQMNKEGEAQYPRSAAEVYNLFWGGQFLTAKAATRGGSLVVNGEVNITGNRNSAESAIAINPASSNLMIAGANGPTGQEMWYSSDSGLTWTRSTSNLGASCCDPTVGW